jgi:hypothetical protein
MAVALLLRTSEEVMSISFLGIWRPSIKVTTDVGSDFAQWRDRSGFSPDSFARRLHQHRNHPV